MLERSVNMVDQNRNPRSGMDVAIMIMKLKVVSMMHSLLGSPIRKMSCHVKSFLKKGIPDANRIYSWYLQGSINSLDLE